MRLGRIVPSFLKPYLKPLYRAIVAAVDPMNPAALPEWLWGLETGRIVETPASLKALHSDAELHHPTAYQVLPYIGAVLRPNDVFFDLGSGMGRVVLYVAGTCRLRKVVGVEFNPQLVNIARTNLLELMRAGKILTPVDLISADAADADLGEGTVFFLFNPFGEATLRKVFGNIRQSLESNPRNIRVLYVNAVLAQVLDQMNWLDATDDLPRLIGRTKIRSWSAQGKK